VAARELSRQGVSAIESGKWQEAEDLLKKSLEASPADAATRSSLAEAFWHRGARQEALTEMEQAIELDKENAILAARAGEMSLAFGDTAEAFARAERAIRCDPKLASAWALRGRCFLKMHQTDKALLDLQHALDFGPNDADVLYDVAAIYRQRGLSARSLTTVHHLLDTYSPGEEPQNALTLEGLALLDLGRPQQAAESLAMAARRGSPDAELLYHLAQAYSASGQYAQAATTAQEALALNGSHEPSRQLLVDLAAHSGPDETIRR
jgi:tetratricopeptide (TPR) repeat protein